MTVWVVYAENCFHEKVIKGAFKSEDSAEKYIDKMVKNAGDFSAWNYGYDEFEVEE